MSPIKRAGWTAAVLSYPCPVCTAGPGQRCHTDSGRTKFEPHASRARLAAANNWQPEST